MVYPSVVYKLETLPPQVWKEAVDFIEFLVQKYGQETAPPVLPKPQFGCLRGTFKMSPDFDEPLEDFKEYMS